MKNLKKLLAIIAILSLVISFSISCTAEADPETAEEPAVIEELEEELQQTKTQLESAEREISDLKIELNRTKAQLEELEDKETTATVEEPEEEITEEPKELEEEIKNIAIEIIEEEFRGRLTKFAISDDFTDSSISYNTRWAVEDTVKKEMYDIIYYLARSSLAAVPADWELTATTDRGAIYVAYTDLETMRKIYNYEIDYNEWLSIAF